jgi:hypothetical protein
MGWAFIYGLSEGNPVKLTVLFDYDGNGCGYNTGFKDHDYIYWPVISFTSFSDIAAKTVCVNRCPTISAQLVASECISNSEYTTCNTATTTAYDSKLYLNRFCIPDLSSAASTPQMAAFEKAVMEDYGGNYLTSYMGDVFTCWWVFIACAGISFVMSFVYMCFIKCCAKILVWITIFLGFFVLLGCAIYIYLTADTYAEEDSTRNYMYYTSYSLFGICAVYLLIVL